MKKTTTILFLMLFVLGGCQQSSGPSASPGVIMPLAVGNIWVYNHIFVEIQGGEIHEPNDTTTLVEKQIIAGEAAYFTYDASAIGYFFLI
jgi:hypothetical protein